MRNHGFNIVDMVHGVVTLQEWHGIMPNNIQMIDWQWKISMRSCNMIFRYTVYVKPWVLGWKPLPPLRKTLWSGCMELVLPMGCSPKRHEVVPVGIESLKARHCIPKLDFTIPLLSLCVLTLIWTFNSCLLHCTWLRCIRSITEDTSHELFISR